MCILCGGFMLNVVWWNDGKCCVMFYVKNVCWLRAIMVLWFEGQYCVLWFEGQYCVMDEW